MKYNVQLEDWEMAALRNLAFLVLKSRQNVGTRMKDAAESAVKILDRIKRTEGVPPTDQTKRAMERLHGAEGDFFRTLAKDALSFESPKLLEMLDRLFLELLEFEKRGGYLPPSVHEAGNAANDLLRETTRAMLQK